MLLLQLLLDAVGGFQRLYGGAIGWPLRKPPSSRSRRHHEHYSGLQPRTTTEGQADEERDRELAAATSADDNDDGEDADETPRTRRRRYQQSTMSEVSDPEE